MFDEDGPIPTADKILETARNIIAHREAVHGEKRRNTANIARLWNAYLETRENVNLPLSPFEVAMMMALLKIARTQTGQRNSDDVLDAIGYLAIGHEVR